MIINAIILNTLVIPESDGSLPITVLLSRMLPVLKMLPFEVVDGDTAPVYLTVRRCPPEH
jgi:hypothetical protein